MSRPWFGQKRYGIGLAPASPAGWAALALFIVAMSVTGPIVGLLHLPFWWIFIAFAVETAALLGLTFAKSDGRPWRWRWGDE